MKTQNGFTLVELVIVLAIIGILVGSALPEIGYTIKNNRLTAKTNAFISALNYARSEAIARGRPVRVQAINAAGALITAGARPLNWGIGWVVWVDLNNNGVLDAGEAIKNFTYPTDGISINTTTAAANGQLSIQYTTRGLPVLNNGSAGSMAAEALTNPAATGWEFLVCLNPRQTGEPTGRRVRVLPMGRVELTSTTVSGLTNCP